MSKDSKPDWIPDLRKPILFLRKDGKDWFVVYTTYDQIPNPPSDQWKKGIPL